MKCYICNAGIEKPDYNSDHEAWEPCVMCLQAIQDTLEGFIDKPFISDEDAVESLSEVKEGDYEGWKRAVYFND